MTAKERRAYSRKYQTMQKALEAKYAKPVYWALKKQVAEFIEAIRSGRDISTMLFNEHIGRVIRRLYLDAGLVAARAMRLEQRAYKQKRASFGTNDELANAIIDYLQRFILDKAVRPISETTRDWVLRVLTKGRQEGKGVYEITSELEGAEFLKFQAERIVRTEIVRATNVGVVAAMEASPYEVEKEWIAAHDNRTRHTHRALDGQKRDLGQDFKPGLAQPGDPRAPAKEVINCRCVVSAVPKRDAQGRLLIKPRAQTSEPVTSTVRPGLMRMIRNFLQTG